MIVIKKAVPTVAVEPPKPRDIKPRKKYPRGATVILQRKILEILGGSGATIAPIYQALPEITRKGLEYHLAKMQKLGKIKLTYGKVWKVVT